MKSIPLHQVLLLLKHSRYAKVENPTTKITFLGPEPTTFLLLFDLLAKSLLELAIMA